MRHHTPAIVVFAIAAAIVGHSTATTYGNEATGAAKPAARPRIVTNFNAGWRFEKGDTRGAEAVEFDDSDWTAVRLPHDWAISGPFDPEEHGFAAKLPWKGVGWYRKSFTLDGPNNGRRVYLDFDGVMAFPQVYVNGKLAGEWDYGYMSFRVDATPHVKFDGENVVAVRVDTHKHGTRWYPGAGIYRKVTLTICNPIHIAHWGTYVTTPRVSKEAAQVEVRTTVENHDDKEVTVSVVSRFRDARGKAMGSVADSVTISAGESKEVGLAYSVLNPQLWDVEHPNLYSIESAVVPPDELSKKATTDENDIDRDTTMFGIRTFRFTPDDGFHLNGRRLQLYGVNLHHDHGPLGAAFYTRAMERQLEIMREIGVNAIRTSHNPPSSELLDLCDRMGFVVWDECFDKWNHTAGRHKGQPPLDKFARRQLRNFVRRDRNHPCVVIWSIANENGGLGGDDGLSKERVAMMRDFVREQDDSRPVALGHHIPEHAYTDVFAPLDVVGWNYDSRYSIFRDRYPDTPIIYSESASTLSTRGFYEVPLPSAKTEYSQQGQVSSYDLNAAIWSDIPDREFELMEQDSFVAGEFVWTGFDYLGEPTPFDEEAVSSYFGIVDLCGLPKDRYYLYRSYWRPDAPTVHIVPHWNWNTLASFSETRTESDDRGSGKRDLVVPVFVYTNGDSAELFLNGRSLGRKTKVSEPAQFVNLASGRRSTASSTLNKVHPAGGGNDGARHTSWRAGRNEAGEWWQLDLGSVQPIRDIVVHFESDLRNYLYQIQISSDGQTWTTAFERDEFWNSWGDRLTHGIDTEGRFVRVLFTGLRGERTNIGLRELIVYRTGYFDVCDKYRLRWLDVLYEPGELKAVAYKDGKQIGDAVMRTAGPPAEIRLKPDRTKLTSSGEDLCYVTVEAFDADGTPCPLADNLVRFQVDGPAEIAGVGNGNPRSYEPFQASERKLFYGKAMLIIRTHEGNGGDVRIKAESDGLKSASVAVVTEPAP